MNLKDLINILIDADKKNEIKEEKAIEDVKTVQTDSVVETPKEEIKTPEVDPKDARIKELTEINASLQAQLKDKDLIITQNNEQISALKDLTSVDNPIPQELSIEELIMKGEF